MSVPLPGPSSGATTGEPSSTGEYTFVGTALVVYAFVPVVGSGIGSVWTGKPVASWPLGRNAWTYPLPSARISTCGPPGRSRANTGEPAPSAFKYLGKPASVPWLGTEKNWRCSMATDGSRSSPGPSAGQAPFAHTTT